MENKMAEVAKLLGLKLGEEFSVGDTDKYVLLDDGLFKTIGKLTYWQVPIENLLTGEWDVVKLPKPILDAAEKRYLTNIIKPFKNQVITISKRSINYGEFINIMIDEGEFINPRNMCLPYFKPGKMYKGMKVNREYTLDQLGL